MSQKIGFLNVCKSIHPILIRVCSANPNQDRDGSCRVKVIVFAEVLKSSTELIVTPRLEMRQYTEMVLS